MKEIRKPQFLIVATNLIIMFCALFGLAWSATLASAPFLPLWLKLVLITMQSLMVVLAVLQCVLYLKNYIDYRLNEIGPNKSVKSA